MRKLHFVLIPILFCVCSPKTEKEKDTPTTKELLPGEWRNLSMKVTVVDPDSVIDVPEGKWEEILRIKPIRTTFQENGSYVSEYRNLGDTVIMSSTGTWEVKGDTLIMEERGNPNAYHVTIENGIATFSGYLDWDEDGKADDYYYGRQKKY